MSEERLRLRKNVDNAMAGALDFKRPGKARDSCRLASCWVWDKTVNEFVKSKVVGYSLNVCAGLSPVGDVRVDLDPKKKGVGMADMNKLPFTDNSFDTVISDPPWKIGLFQRMRPFSECVRVCKPGGRIIYNCTWRPVSRYVVLEEAVIRTDNNWSNVSVIWIFKKGG